MKLAALLITSLICIPAYAAPFPRGDAQAGQNMFAQLHCNRCHSEMVGGDGSGIFTRSDSKIHNPAQLVAQIGVCGGNVNKEFTAQEKQDIAAYLNRYYNFK